MSSLPARTRAGSLAGHLHAVASARNESKELCRQHAIDAQKEINSLTELGDDLLRNLRRLVSKKAALHDIQSLTARHLGWRPWRAMPLVGTYRTAPPGA